MCYATDSRVSYDSGFDAGLKTAKDYDRIPQPQCGHISANIERISVGAGETEEYCSVCLEIRSEIDRDRELWSDYFITLADVAGHSSAEGRQLLACAGMMLTRRVSLAKNTNRFDPRSLRDDIDDNLWGV